MRKETQRLRAAYPRRRRSGQYDRAEPLRVEVNLYRSAASEAPARFNIMLLHAAGLLKECWEPVAETLLTECPGLGCVIAPDIITHGQSALLNEGWLGIFNSWLDNARDAIAVADQLALPEPTVLVGHSMGGSAALVALAMRPHGFAGAVVYEPVASREPDSRFAPIISRIVRQPEVFPSWQSARDALRKTPLFRSFDARVFERYVAHGLTLAQASAAVPLTTDKWTAGSVRCTLTRLQEMQTYLDAEPGEKYGLQLTYDALPLVADPVVYVTGDQGKWNAKGAEAANSARTPGSIVSVLSGGHMQPMEAPERFAREIMQHVPKMVQSWLEDRSGTNANVQRKEYVEKRLGQHHYAAKL